MDLIYTLKKFVSRFTDKPISLGYGASTDTAGTLNISEQQATTDIEYQQYETSAIYDLNKNAGGFEMHGHYRNSKGEVMIRLSSLKTGEVYSFKLKDFTYLFEVRK
jgi:hypothetical protein